MCTLTPSSTSGFATVNLSSNAGCPAAGADTTLPVVGSTSVSGIGSFSGVPLTSVPNGAGFDALADELDLERLADLIQRQLIAANHYVGKRKDLGLELCRDFRPAPCSGEHR